MMNHATTAELLLHSHVIDGVALDHPLARTRVYCAAVAPRVTPR